MHDKQYDIIICGAGLSGLVTAYTLTQKNINLSILLIDPLLQKAPTHTISFWTDKELPFPNVLEKTWKTVTTHTNNQEKTTPLQHYIFALIRAAKLYIFIQKELRSKQNILWEQEEVCQLKEFEDHVQVCTTKTKHETRYAFDSRPITHTTNLYMQGQGWEITTTKSIFEPEIAVFMDTRNTDPDVLAFYYALPFSATQALIDYVTIHKSTENKENEANKLREYIENNLHCTNYTITRNEGSNIRLPLTTRQRHPTQRCADIGIRGGMLKATTGYAFTRVLQDAENIAKLVTNEEPLTKLSRSPTLCYLLDKFSLQAIKRKPGQVKSKLEHLLQEEDINTIFRFLDEKTTISETLKIMYRSLSG
jgi:lycopene beta-cyclase